MSGEWESDAWSSLGTQAGLWDSSIYDLVPFNYAIDINPGVKLSRGELYAFVDMAQIDPNRSLVQSIARREFKGGGSRFKDGDTLFARITPCLENGKIARYVSMVPDQIAHGSTEFIVMRGREGISDNNYVFYLVKSASVRSYAISRMNGSSGRQRVATDAFSGLSIPLPPLPEQRRIAKILGDLDDKIELNRKMNETLEQMARALFKSWFVDFDPVRAKMEGRTPSGMDAATAALFPDRLVDSELGPIPEGWEVGSIYDVAEVVYGAPFASKDFTSDPVGRPLIRIRDLSTENPRVYTSEVHPKGYLVNPGDVVVGMDGEFRAHLWGGPVSWLNQRLCVFVPKETFGTAFIMNSIANPLAEVEATETATTVIHLGKNDIDRFRIVVPASNISSRYALLCQPLFDQIVFNKLQSRTLLTLRDTLLPKLVGGEVRVAQAPS